MMETERVVGISRLFTAASLCRGRDKNDEKGERSAYLLHTGNHVWMSG